MFRVLCVFGLVLLANPAAFSHGTHQLGEVDFLNCERLPQNAARGLPAPADTWATIACLPRGTTLVAAPGWQWRYPNSFFDRPIAPAWAPDASVDEPGAKYFIDFSITTIEGNTAADQHARLAKAVPAYGSAQPAPPATLYRMDAENNLGHEMVFWFSRTSEHELWAFLCTPECRADYAFIIQKQ